MCGCAGTVKDYHNLSFLHACSNSSSKIFPVIQAFLFDLYTKGRGNLDVHGNEHGLDDFLLLKVDFLLPAIITPN